MKHPYLVKFFGVSDNPIAIMMEFCAFSFKPFQKDAVVNSLEEFLSIYHQDCLHSHFPTILTTIVHHISSAIQYIHGKNIVHRDIKPANILVTNLHYSHLSDEHLTEVFLKEPIICKLADLGEARSNVLQTKVMSSHSRTQFVRRGSPAYMAPEIILKEIMLKSAGIEDLKAVDVWALLMTIFVVLNPDQKFPFQHDLENISDRNGFTDTADMLLDLLRKEYFPTFSKSYEEMQASCYSNLRHVFLKNLKYKPSERSSIKEIQDDLMQESDIHFMQLAVSQASALERSDH